MQCMLKIDSSFKLFYDKKNEFQNQQSMIPSTLYSVSDIDSVKYKIKFYITVKKTTHKHKNEKKIQIKTLQNIRFIKYFVGKHIKRTTHMCIYKFTTTRMFEEFTKHI